VPGTDGRITQVNGLQFAAAVISSLVWPAVVVGFIVGFRKQFKTVF
jgi:hypothetical protein